jgi:hypothetical protein
VCWLAAFLFLQAMSSRAPARAQSSRSRPEASTAFGSAVLSVYALLVFRPRAKNQQQRIVKYLAAAG